MNKSLAKAVRNLNMLESRLRAHENKYGLKSSDFYTAMISGQLAEFDGEDEYHLDFLEWLGLYETWLDREHAYHALLQRQAVTAQLKLAVAI